MTQPQPQQQDQEHKIGIIAYETVGYTPIDIDPDTAYIQRAITEGRVRKVRDLPDGQAEFEILPPQPLLHGQPVSYSMFSIINHPKEPRCKTD